MSEIESKDAETIRALVEYTWKQENIDRIRGEIGKYLEKIADEIKQSVEKQLISEVARTVEARMSGEIKAELENRLTNEMKTHIAEIREDVKRQITSEIKGDVEKEITQKQKNLRLFLAFVLSLASIGLGIAIAAIAGLVH